MGNLIVCGIDPAPVQTALTVWDGQRVLHKMLSPNDEVRNWILAHLDSHNVSALAVEGIQPMGMAVGKTVFDTAFFVGHLQELLTATGPKVVLKVNRTRIKLHHTGGTKANDSQIRAALIARFGEPGNKKNPGVLFGVANDIWSSTAIAVWAHDVLTNGAPRQEKKGKKK
jgi:hypothetical protein